MDVYGGASVETDSDPISQLLQLQRRLEDTLNRTARELETLRSLLLDLEQAVSSIDDLNVANRTAASAQLQKLSLRELDVLRAIINGRSTKQVAFELGITFKTAVSHRTRLMQKLQVHDTATLVRLALTGGMR